MCLLHLQLEGKFENIRFSTSRIGRIVRALGAKIAMLIIGRYSRIEAIDDIIHAPSISSRLLLWSG